LGVKLTFLPTRILERRVSEGEVKKFGRHLVHDAGSLWAKYFLGDRVVAGLEPIWLNWVVLESTSETGYPELYGSILRVCIYEVHHWCLNDELFDFAYGISLQNGIYAPGVFLRFFRMVLLPIFAGGANILRARCQQICFNSCLR